MRKKYLAFIVGGLLASGCIPNSTLRNVVNNATVDVADTLVNLILIQNLEDALDEETESDI